MSLHLHHPLHHVTFTAVDPLGDGLREEILAEQAEPERIVLDERPEEGKLVGYLEAITADVQNDTDEFTFSED
jgi:hypothetical protein